MNEVKFGNITCIWKSNIRFAGYYEWSNDDMIFRINLTFRPKKRYRIFTKLLLGLKWIDNYEEKTI